MLSPLQSEFSIPPVKYVHPTPRREIADIFIVSNHGPPPPNSSRLNWPAVRRGIRHENRMCIVILFPGG